MLTFSRPRQASAECALGRVVGALKSTYCVPVTGSDGSGGIVVRAEEIKGDFVNEDALTLTFRGIALAAKDPYLQVPAPRAPISYCRVI
jgi:hypothetical protein